ncbi:2-hydroxy-3-keto-5-methylthiopentenyl-1-phosphate phosphatase [Brevibacillus daliensis]|uniref:2-hydroxy-3-keto-5-methylthiopentenyl-1- phosphate phosphatase n=1 Tax=Brevibacillus daliensis TaxID=2892995 RepID=UPI001E4154C9|nr:2-hydroxy-3-keto-5-methylthiopentenyl-1-phosphate phosphatase [Brevibacillus daliensis]
MTKQLVLFCDFDGTITEKDNIVAIMRQFNPPGWEELTEQILSQKISIQEGVGRLFASIPSSQKEEVTQFALSQATVREGFGPFVQYCEEYDIKLLITSGGINFFVHPILEPFNLTGPVFCNGSDFSEEQIRITWPHPCDEHCQNNCGMCKTTILRSYDASLYTRVVIGDSITDLAASRLADYVIARSLLLKKCEEENLPYQPFTTFYEVIDAVKKSQVKLGVS